MYPLASYLLLLLSTGLIITALQTRLVPKPSKKLVPEQLIFETISSQGNGMRDDHLCLLKTCQTLYFANVPAKTTCSWKLCNDFIHPDTAKAIPEAYIAETQTDTHLSVRTKRWQFADSLQLCMNLQCVGLEGNDLYQCAYDKCVYVKTV